MAMTFPPHHKEVDRAGQLYSTRICLVLFSLWESIYCWYVGSHGWWHTSPYRRWLWPASGIGFLIQYKPSASNPLSLYPAGREPGAKEPCLSPQGKKTEKFKPQDTQWRAPARHADIRTIEFHLGIDSILPCLVIILCYIYYLFVIIQQIYISCLPGSKGGIQFFISMFIAQRVPHQCSHIVIDFGGSCVVCRSIQLGSCWQTTSNMCRPIIVYLLWHRRIDYTLREPVSMYYCTYIQSPHSIRYSQAVNGEDGDLIKNSHALCSLSLIRYRLSRRPLSPSLSRLFAY